jgi:hypothetical protein
LGLAPGFALAGPHGLPNAPYMYSVPDRISRGISNKKSKPNVFNVLALKSGPGSGSGAPLAGSREGQGARIGQGGAAGPGSRRARSGGAGRGPESKGARMGPLWLSDRAAGPDQCGYLGPRDFSRYQGGADSAGRGIAREGRGPNPGPDRGQRGPLWQGAAGPLWRGQGGGRIACAKSAQWHFRDTPCCRFGTPRPTVTIRGHPLWQKRDVAALGHPLWRIWDTRPRPRAVLQFGDRGCGISGTGPPSDAVLRGTDGGPKKWGDRPFQKKMGRSGKVWTEAESNRAANFLGHGFRQRCGPRHYARRLFWRDPHEPVGWGPVRLPSSNQPQRGKGIKPRR